MPRKILIVDDDEQLLRMYGRLLGGQGHVLSLAGGARRGLELLACGAYDLVITDMELGDGTGSEIIEAAYGTKTILVTGSVGADELKTLQTHHNLAAAFEKPFKLEALLVKVNELFA